jgi:hypothetical protein
LTGYRSALPLVISVGWSQSARPRRRPRPTESAPDARTQLASLKDSRSSWQREDFIENGGWARIAGEKYDQAAELCADRLTQMEAPSAQEATASEAGAVTQ